jgi:copper chaperone CopZ
MPTLDLTAPDISCQHCKASIEHDLGAAPGVRGVAVDIPTKAVVVDFDEHETDEERIRSTLSEIGYPAS